MHCDDEVVLGVLVLIICASQESGVQVVTVQIIVKTFKSLGVTQKFSFVDFLHFSLSKHPRSNNQEKARPHGCTLSIPIMFRALRTHLDPRTGCRVWFGYRDLAEWH